LIGASKPSQIIDNVGMLSKQKFSEDELQKIEQICG
ncbi:MAG TPA: L-glyceraldehyde 3-phosphate reductase, partial [Lachnospiraceae bacterium]|nr:L-glyceraldehyde 3-phosphate reductase [Lachnospiraceae bacterium]